MGVNACCGAHCVEAVGGEGGGGGEGVERGDREQISGGCQVSLGNLP